MAVVQQFKLSLNINKNLSPEKIIVTANDNVEILVTLKEGRDDFPLLPEYTYKLVSKPRNKPVTIKDLEVKDGEIVAPLNHSETGYQLPVECIVQVFDDEGNRITSTKFDVVVLSDLTTGSNVSPSGNATFKIVSEDELNEIISSTEGVAKVIHLQENEIGTSKIQSALDNGGRVDVYIDNVAFVDKTLLIGDNTELNIKTGILREKVGTRNYILKNKDQVNGNENITINGTFDVDGDNNLPTGGYTSGEYPGHGIFFHNVKNLRSDYIKIMRCKKYAGLFVNIENMYFKTYEVDTFSDGLHFQGDTININFDLVTGTSHDDLIAWTMQDYVEYRVTDVGQVKNVTFGEIRGVDAKAGLLLHGGGADDQTIFEDFHIGRITGTYTETTVRVTSDNGDGHLGEGTVNGNTRLKNFSIDSIYAHVVGDGMRLTPRHADTVTFNKVEIKTDASEVIHVTNVDKLIVQSFVVPSSSVVASNLKCFSLENVSDFFCNNVHVSSVKESSGSFVQTLGNVSNIFIGNAIFYPKWANFIHLRTGSVVDSIKLNNVSLGELSLIAVEETAILNKGLELNGVSSDELLTVNVNTPIRITGESQIKIYKNGSPKISVNSSSIIMRQYIEQVLEPVLFDKIVTSDGDRGLCIWNGTTWKSLVN